MRRHFVQLPDGSLVETIDTIVYAPARRDGILWNDRAYQDMGDPRFKSRSEHREYMRKHNLSMACDYTEFWEKEAKKRAEFKDPSRVQDVIKALDNPQKGLSRKDLIPKE
jgi:hypothetical protein